MIEIETRPRAKKSAITQYTLLLAKSGRLQEAEKEALSLIRQYPSDPYFKKFLANLRQPGENTVEAMEIEWSEDLSPFLRNELESAEFYDDRILAKDGVPSPEDAARLMQESLAQIKEHGGEHREWMTQFRKHQNITELERSIAVALIDRILIYKDNRVEVHFRFEDEFAWQMDILRRSQIREVV